MKKKTSLLILAIIAILGFVTTLIFVVLNILKLNTSKSNKSVSLDILTQAKANLVALGLNSFKENNTIDSETEIVEINDVVIRDTSENYYLSSGQNIVVLANFPYLNYPLTVLTNDNLFDVSEYKVSENIITFKTPVTNQTKVTVQYKYLLNL